MAKQDSKPAAGGSSQDSADTPPVTSADTPPKQSSDPGVLGYVAADRVVYGKGGKMVSGAEVRKGHFDEKTLDMLRSDGTIVSKPKKPEKK